jgi:two-component system, OmpR family, sensor histidine kinase SenX3
LDRVALLAHQLRTPLSAINALAQGLIRRADQLSTHDVRAKAEKIWRASLRLDELTETILSYKPGDRRWNRTQPKRVQPR